MTAETENSLWLLALIVSVLITTAAVAVWIS